MNLIKVKGIVIKETTYKENDKIITLLTDKLGKISCIARGAKKTNSPILANSQYLVYSEFVLYKSKKFYYINTGEVINNFYNLRIDFDKLNLIFELTRIINNVTDENQDTEKILKLFLNTIYVIEKQKKDINVVIATFKIKLFDLLGFAPRTTVCSNCNNPLENNVIYYDYVSNRFLCENCTIEDKRRYIKISNATLIAIRYIIASDIKKIFSFELKKTEDFKLFGQVFADAMTSGI